MKLVMTAHTPVPLSWTGVCLAASGVEAFASGGSTDEWNARFATTAVVGTRPVGRQRPMHIDLDPRPRPPGGGG